MDTTCEQCITSKGSARMNLVRRATPIRRHEVKGTRFLDDMLSHSRWEYCSPLTTRQTKVYRTA